MGSAGYFNTSRSGLFTDDPEQENNSVQSIMCSPSYHFDIKNSNPYYLTGTIWTGSVSQAFNANDLGSVAGLFIECLNPISELAWTTGSLLLNYHWINGDLDSPGDVIGGFAYNKWSPNSSGCGIFDVNDYNNINTYMDDNGSLYLLSYLSKFIINTYRWW